jgi:hypothetical protein
MPHYMIARSYPADVVLLLPSLLQVEEVTELVKAAASPVYHEAFALGRPGEKSTSKG